MHEFLRAIGLKSIKTKEQLRLLTDWVAEAPTKFRVATLSEDENLAMAERLITDSTGVAVVGSVDEQGKLVPEYYFPYLVSNVISSEAPLSVEKQASRNGYSGLAEDERLDLSLIFSVKNVTEAAKNQKEGMLTGQLFRRVSLSLLLSDGTVLLPIAVPDRVLKANEDREKRRKEFLADVANGDPAAFEKMARESVLRFEKMMERVEKSDVYSVVNSFFMPYGMESERYYFLGTITHCRLVDNRLTKEKFYVMTIDVNGVPFAVTVNEQDLTGVPAEGYRLRGHAWMQGELKY